MTPEQICDRIQTDCDRLARTFLDAGYRFEAIRALRAACTFEPRTIVRDCAIDLQDAAERGGAT